jgi:hypothetical protein
MTVQENAAGIRANGEIESEILKPPEDSKIYIEQIRLV